MSMLTPTEVYGTVAWLGIVPGEDRDDITARAVDEITLDWGGPVGDVHHGATRGACVRVKRQYAPDTEIRNVRQLSIVSVEELGEIASGLGIPEVAPEWLGATMVLEGIPELTRLPPASRLIAESGVALTTDTENAPCRYPADVIEAHHPGYGRAFPQVARRKRGITAWVECPGALRRGDRLRVHLPARHLWEHG